MELHNYPKITHNKHLHEMSGKRYNTIKINA